MPKPHVPKGAGSLEPWGEQYRVQEPERSNPSERNGKETPGGRRAVEPQKRGRFLPENPYPLQSFEQRAFESYAPVGLKGGSRRKPPNSCFWMFGQAFGSEDQVFAAFLEAGKATGEGLHVGGHAWVRQDPGMRFWLDNPEAHRLPDEEHPP